MIRTLLTFIFIYGSLAAVAQEAQFQTYSADLLVIASKDNDNIQWQNKDIRVTLNYKNGNIKIVIKDNDFYNKQSQIRVKEDNGFENQEFLFVGNLPINQINNQKTINQDYDVELQLTNDDISLSEVINFKMNVMRPNQNATSYRVFTLTGILYNDVLNLPAFKGYNNEVEIRVIFNVYWNGE